MTIYTGVMMGTATSLATANPVLNPQQECIEIDGSGNPTGRRKVNGGTSPAAYSTLAYVPVTATPAVASIDAGSLTINNVADPTTAQQAATRAFVLAQIAALVAGAPGALDTIKELADAIADDANYATTITTALAAKVAGAASSVDSEIMLFSGTGGKTAKRASTTGLLKATSGVLSAAVAGTDYAYPPLYVARSTNLARNNATTVLTDDPVLTVTLPAAGTYEVLAYVSIGAPTNADFRAAWNTSALTTPVLNWRSTGWNNALAIQNGHLATADFASIGASGTGGATNVDAELHGFLTCASGGAFTLQWMQDTVQTTFTTLYAGSCLLIRRIA